VLLPALGATFEQAPYRFSSAGYGLLYFPEILGAIGSALWAGTLRRRWGEGVLFRLGAGANLLALAFLSAAFFARGTVAYGAVLAETICLGLGFGLANTALNHLTASLFPDRETRAITLLNAVIGGATAVSPLLLHVLAAPAGWVAWPLLLALAWIILIARPPPVASVPVARTRAPWRLPVAAGLAVLLYAIVEGSFGSWAAVFVSVNRALPVTDGALALSLFWASMTGTRLLLGAIPDRILSRRVCYLASPLGIALCFLVLPALRGAPALIAAFAAAGIATGIYYPYTLSYALKTQPTASTEVAGLLVGALMAGEGIGSFGLGPLQGVLRLGALYRLSALWALPLFALAWSVSRRKTRPIRGSAPPLG
jgi:fucose permease